jgi:hypothetical protein
VKGGRTWTPCRMTKYVSRNRRPTNCPLACIIASVTMLKRYELTVISLLVFACTTGILTCLCSQWFFSKYRIKKNIMNCEKNLLRPPPKDLLGKFDYAISPPRADRKDSKTYTEMRVHLDKKQEKREVFMLCGMINAVNEALRYHKHHACKGSGNLNETYTIHDDPTDW